MRVSVETERNKFVPKKFVAKLFVAKNFGQKKPPDFSGDFLLSVRRLLLPSCLRLVGGTLPTSWLGSSSSLLLIVFQFVLQFF